MYASQAMVLSERGQAPFWKGVTVIVEGQSQMEFLADDIRVPQDVDYADLVKRVREFTICDVLRFCSQVSSWLDDKALPDVKLPVPISRKYHNLMPARIYLTQWRVAFLAKTSILHSSDGMHGWLKPPAFIGLAYMYANMKDSFTRGLPTAVAPDAAKGMMIRTAWEQFGYQGNLNRDIPRGWLLMVDGGRTIGEPAMDVDDEFRKITGLDIAQFMTVGFGYYSGLCSYEGPFAHSAVVRHFPSTGVMEGKISQQDCERFLRHGAATYNEFRALSEPRVGDPLYVKTEFNVLLSRPLLAVKNEILCPVPRLILHHITDGVIFSLMDAFRGVSKSNRFREFFGRLFEHYVGRLLRWSYGDTNPNVHFEPRYGSPELRGPDWVVIDGDTAILIECRTSSMRLETKVYGEAEAISKDIERMIFSTVQHLSGKIEDLKAGRTGIDTSEVKRYECIVLLYDQVFFESVYREAIKAQFIALGEEAFEDYQLMDIERFELLSSWHGSGHFSMKEFLLRRAGDLRGAPEKDFRTFLHEFHVEHRLPDHHPLLNQILDDFFLSHFDLKEPSGEEFFDAM
jgi:hypothetical protein